jgi:hypothetical protein
MGLLRGLADLTGLSMQVTQFLADPYKGPWTYAPGAVFADLAAAVADGADCIDGIGQLYGDREHVFGAKASTTTMWRLVDQRMDAAPLPKIRSARSAARAAAWAAGAAPRLVSRGRSPSGITLCWRFWTARRSAAGKRWPGCCAKATPGPTPPPTTSPSWRRP